MFNILSFILSSFDDRMLIMDRTELPFSLTPAQGADCIGLTSSAAQAAGISCPGNTTYNERSDQLSDWSAHVCVKCNAQLTITLTEGSHASVGFASLMGPRFKNTTARADSVAALEQMGVRLIRSGGSVACDPTMAWTMWRGKQWQRPSARYLTPQVMSVTQPPRSCLWFSGSMTHSYDTFI